MSKFENGNINYGLVVLVAVVAAVISWQMRPMKKSIKKSRKMRKRSCLKSFWLR